MTKIRRKNVPLQKKNRTYHAKIDDNSRNREFPRRIVKVCHLYDDEERMRTRFPMGHTNRQPSGMSCFRPYICPFQQICHHIQSLVLLFTTGICGGFTTFSTFANESMQMLQSGNIGGFIGYVSTSVIGGIALIGLGYWIIK